MKIFEKGYIYQRLLSFAAHQERWVMLEGDGYLHYYKPLVECGKISVQEFKQINETEMVTLFYLFLFIFILFLFYFYFIFILFLFYFQI
jgi:hypothetical protein